MGKQVINIIMYCCLAIASQAKVEALFHPYDPTLEKIASHLSQARNHIDIAMYNIDVSDESPVIRMLKSDDMQIKLQSGALTMRMIFEGYATEAENKKRMDALEKLGIDVRCLSSSKKVHHKFAVIDTNSPAPFLITGSANWSLGSRKNYNENILFIENEPHLNEAFQNEFNLLWAHAKEFGNSNSKKLIEPLPTKSNPHLQVFMNSQNFEFRDGQVSNGRIENGYFLTRRIVEAIDQAQSSLKIATTRLKLAPIYHSLLRAAQRGVKIQIVLSMEEYTPFYLRRKAKLKTCENIYTPKCSSGVDYSVFLTPEYTKTDNIELRIKYFSLNPQDYLIKQMHNKYILIDDRELLTGSFNWSNSSEWDNIENLVYLNTLSAAEAITQFENDFQRLWNLNRRFFDEYLKQIQNTARGQTKINCLMTPMTLTQTEIDRLMYPAGTNKRAKDLCQK